jgi:two-component system, NarL family, sensor kinase
MHLQEINIQSFIITGTAIIFMIALVSFIIAIIQQRKIIRCHQELRKLNEQQGTLILAAVRSEESERKKISATLHDEVGAVLSAVKLYLNQIHNNHLNDQAKIITLNDCKELLNDTVQTVRNLSATLQPATIKDFGLLSTMQSFCDKLNASQSLKVSVVAEGEIDRFQTEHELAVFRIIEELTNNIIHHANAETIQFSLVRKSKNVLLVFIEHNGEGLSQEEYEQKLYHSNGLGLKNIQNRLRILKGAIHFEKSDNLMNVISVQIPFIT